MFCHEEGGAGWDSNITDLYVFGGVRNESRRSYIFPEILFVFISLSG